MEHETLLIRAQGYDVHVNLIIASCLVNGPWSFPLVGIFDPPSRLASGTHSKGLY